MSEPFWKRRSNAPYPWSLVAIAAVLGGSVTGVVIGVGAVVAGLVWGRDPKPMHPFIKAGA